MPRATIRKDTSAKKKNATKKRVATSKRASAKVSKEGEWMGIPYESGCELAALQFFFALKKAGFVSKIERSESWLVTEPLIHSYVEQLKRGSKTVQQTLMNGQSYTADFKVTFTKKAIDKFIWVIGSRTKWQKHMFIAQNGDTEDTYTVIVEVKPDKSRNDTSASAMKSMKFVYHVYKVFINMFKPDKVFSGLFTPEEYKLTPTGAPRKLRFKAISLTQYLNKCHGIQ